MLAADWMLELVTDAPVFPPGFFPSESPRNPPAQRARLLPPGLRHDPPLPVRENSPASKPPAYASLALLQNCSLLSQQCSSSPSLQIHLHGADFQESLGNFFSPPVLPREYGGEGPGIEEACQDWTHQLLQSEAVLQQIATHPTGDIAVTPEPL